MALLPFVVVGFGGGVGARGEREKSSVWVRPRARGEGAGDFVVEAAGFDAFVRGGGGGDGEGLLEREGRGDSGGFVEVVDTVDGEGRLDVGKRDRDGLAGIWVGDVAVGRLRSTDGRVEEVLVESEEVRVRVRGGSFG